jgi:colanic acid biosynthesis glycosyl transferase WcaI
MKVLLTAKRFPPEAPATAVLGYELAEELARRGHEVTVAAGYPQHPHGRLFPGFRRRLVSGEQINGFRLFRGWHLIHPSPSMFMRSLVMASQCVSYLFSATRAERPEVVISFDNYPILGFLASALIARRARARLVSVIYDLYPDIAIELGKLRHPGLIALARKLEAMVYRSSDRIVVLSEGLRRTLVEDKGVDPQKVAVIPVWLDAKDIVPLNRDNPWRRETGIPSERFVVLYAGTIGLVSGAEVIVEAARHLGGHPEILLLLVGDGYGKKLAVFRAKSLGFSNILFLPFQPRERLSELQAAADVSVVTLAPGRGRTSVPSKALGYMAAARPVIAAVDGDCDTADLVREAGCGQVTPPGDDAALARAILMYYHSPEARTAAGVRGREYFLKHLEKQIIMEKYLELLKALEEDAPTA